MAHDSLRPISFRPRCAARRPADPDRRGPGPDRCGRPPGHGSGQRPLRRQSPTAAPQPAHQTAHRLDQAAGLAPQAAGTGGRRLHRPSDRNQRLLPQGRQRLAEPQGRGRGHLGRSPLLVPRIHRLGLRAGRSADHQGVAAVDREPVCHAAGGRLFRAAEEPGRRKTRPRLDAQHEHALRAAVLLRIHGRPARAGPDDEVLSLGADDPRQAVLLRRLAGARATATTWTASTGCTTARASRSCWNWPPSCSGAARRG